MMIRSRCFSFAGVLVVACGSVCAAAAGAITSPLLHLTVLPHGVNHSNETALEYWRRAPVIPSARIQLVVGLSGRDSLGQGFEEDRILQLKLTLKSLRNGKAASLSGTLDLDRLYSINLGEGGAHRIIVELTFVSFNVTRGVKDFTIGPVAPPTAALLPAVVVGSSPSPSLLSHPHPLFGAEVAMSGVDGEEPSSPPAELPPDFMAKFLMNGRVPLYRYYFDDTEADKTYPRYSRKAIDGLVSKAAQRREGYYGPTDSFLYQAFARHPIVNKRVLIVGSNVPFYEAICLFHNASSCSTLEYNELRYEHPNLTTATVAEWEEQRVAGGPPCDWHTQMANCKWDAVVSISSLEHDGLGRYGDQLNPNGDLLAMESIRGSLTAGGLLFLAVPVGRDALYWNEGRIYGALRLPELIRAFTLVSSWGVPFSAVSTADEGLLAEAQHRSERMAPGQLFQPILVLSRGR